MFQVRSPEPRRLSKAAYRKAQRDDGTNKESLKKFDLAIVRVLAAETADKAREIAESVIA